MADSVRVIAHIIAVSGKEAELKQLLQDLVEATRAEAGCLRYELMQSSATPTHFATWEEWISEEALNQHLSSGHVETAFREGESFLGAAPIIQRYDDCLSRDLFLGLDVTI
jgi:quinol monooxygenase YgiN